MTTKQVTIEPTTQLFGSGSHLDSMAFVSFVTDVEERLSQISAPDFFIVLSDIEELFPEAPSLTADMFAEYLLGIIEY
jgi:acyl carrier protein